MVRFMEMINVESIDATLLKMEICMISMKHLLDMTICTAMSMISKLFSRTRSKNFPRRPSHPRPYLATPYFDYGLESMANQTMTGNHGPTVGHQPITLFHEHSL